jgi:drug/metabolite transporter (DMT)-like permease
MQRRDHLDGVAVASLVGCCALWGLNQVAIKATLPEVPSLVQVSIRSGIAVLLVLAWMRYRGIAWNLRDGTLLPGLLAGSLFAIEFALMFLGLQYTTAARSVLFINTSPFIVALVLAALLPAERLSVAQVGGLVVAFASLALVFGERIHGGSWQGDVLILTAAALWGMTTVTIRMSSLRNAPPEKTLAYQLLVSALLSPLGAWALGEPWPMQWSGLAVASLFYQAVIVTFASYLLWFWLLTRYPATRVQAFTFLSPVMGMAWAAALLGEALSMRLVLGLAGIAVGLLLLNRRVAR